MTSSWHFPVLVLVSLIAFAGLLFTVLGHRTTAPTSTSLLSVAGIVVVGGMLFARMGAGMGLPVWVYYGVPAVVTWVLPPLAFRMRSGEIAMYVPLAALIAPIIHVMFSFFLGWKEYMPFLPVPAFWELMS